ncbi:MAG: hypothetical protein WA254_02595 [Candidatus Sulfotelmatobacter sp.]
MRRQITGLNAADRCAADQVPDGIFLVRVQRVYFRRQAQKPNYTITLDILEPSTSGKEAVVSVILRENSKTGDRLLERDAQVWASLFLRFSGSLHRNADG